MFARTDVDLIFARTDVGLISARSEAERKLDPFLGFVLLERSDVNNAFNPDEAEHSRTQPEIASAFP